jgi:hypothetical protein
MSWLARCLSKYRHRSLHEPGDEWINPSVEHGLIDMRESLTKAAVEYNAEMGAGKLASEIRNIGRDLPAASATAPAARVAPTEHNWTHLHIISEVITATQEKPTGDSETNQTNQRPDPIEVVGAVLRNPFIEEIGFLLYLRAFNSGLSDHHPDGYHRVLRSNALKSINSAEQRFGTDLLWWTPEHFAYSALIDWCLSVACDETPSQATYDLIESAINRGKSTDHQ